MNSNYDNWKLEPSPYEDVLTFEEWIEDNGMEYLKLATAELNITLEDAYAEYLLNPYTE